MFLKSFNFLLKSIIVIFLLLLVFTIAAAIFIAKEERDLAFLSKIIENKIKSHNPNLNAKIDKTILALDDNYNIILSAKNINITYKNKFSADIPEMIFDFNFTDLFLGSLASSNITALNANFNFSTVAPISKDKSNLKNFFKDYTEEIYDLLNHKNNFFEISNLILKNAAININTGDQILEGKILTGNISVTDGENNNYNLVSKLEINLYDDITDLNIFITTDRKDNIIFSCNIEDLDSEIFNNFSYLLADLNINFKLNAQIGALIGRLGNYKEITANIYNSILIVNNTDLFEQGAILNNINMEVSYNNGQIIAQNITADLEKNTALTAHANFIDIFSDNYNYNIDLSLKDLAIDKLRNYWPPIYAGKTRKWVINHVTKGNIKNSRAILNFNKDNINLFKKYLNNAKNDNISKLPAFNNDILNIDIDIEDAQVNYHPNYPKAEKVSAHVKVTQNNVIITAHKADILNSKIDNSVIAINDIWQRPLRLDIEGKFNGKAGDAIKFLQVSLANSESSPYLKSIYNIKGDIDADVKISFPLIKNFNYKQTDFNLKGKIKNALLPKFFNQKDLKNADINLAIINNNINAEVKADIENAKISGIYYKNLNDDNLLSTNKLKITADFEELNKIFSYDVAAYLQGSFDADLDIKEYLNRKEINSTINLKNSVIDIKKYNYFKPSNLDSKVTLAIKLENNNLYLSNINYISHKDKLTGDIELQLTGNKQYILKTLDFDEVKFAENNLIIRYLLTGNAKKIELTGKKIDLRNISFNEIIAGSNSSKENNINIKFAEILLKNNQTIQDFSASLICEIENCIKFNITGKLNNINYIVADLKFHDGRKTLFIESDNAGALFKALNFSTHISGGKLNIQTTATKENGLLIAQGYVTINNFKAVKTPLLGNILTLASLSGLSDLLYQEGISFKSFEAPIIYKDSVIYINNAQTAGSSLNITADGTINTKTSMLNIEGSIASSQILNNIINKIPLFGEVISGGKDEALLATNYKIKGPYDKVKIEVNPLSMLAPGFLRKIFK